MTFREKLKQDNPEFTEEQINKVITNCCPDTYNYEDESDCDCVKKQGDKRCESCWNREIPNTEFKQNVSNPPMQEVLDELNKNIKTIPQSEVDAYNQGHADGMAQGMNDAWGLAIKLGNLERRTLYEIFRIEDAWLTDVLETYTPQEALVKLKAYEEAQRKIEVGDVVVLEDEEFVITRVNKTPPTITISGLNAKGEAICWSDENYKKTGKHIDINSILEQIGGE